MTFEYNAVVVRVVDGDTIVAGIDLGFDVWLHDINLRLIGVNAREKAEIGGAEARRNLSALLPEDTHVVLRTVKPDKFGGRYDAAVTLPDGRDLSTLLIQEGWAVPWTGRGVKPNPPWPRMTPPA